MARIKGFAIRGVLKQVKAAGRPGGIPALLATLPAETRAVFAQPIVNSSWYPYEAFAALLRAADREIGRGDLSLMPEFGYRAGREDFGTVFKVIAAIASVETILKRGMVFWSQYCDTGRFEMSDVNALGGRATLRDFPGIDAAHCALIAGWTRGIGESAGAKNAAVTQVRCVHRGDPVCEYVATWQK